MQNLRVLIAAAGIGTLMTLPQAASASPLAAGLAGASPHELEQSAGLVEKIHRRYRYGRYRHYHRHRYYRRYPRYRHYYYDDYYYPYYYPYYSYYRPYRYRPYYPGPFITFGFGGWRF